MVNKLHMLDLQENSEIIRFCKVIALPTRLYGLSLIHICICSLFTMSSLHYIFVRACVRVRVCVYVGAVCVKPKIRKSHVLS